MCDIIPPSGVFKRMGGNSRRSYLFFTQGSARAHTLLRKELGQILNRALVRSRAPDFSKDRATAHAYIEAVVEVTCD